MRYHKVFLCLGLLAMGGCSTLFDSHSVRSQSPDEPEKNQSHVKRVGDLAAPFGMFPIRIEGVGLVTGLAGKGSDPAPSAQRAALVAEMQARGVEVPSKVLASKNCSLVLVQAYLRPGIQKGDRVDIEVRVPANSETISLRGGWLLETRLREMAMLNDNRMHEGHPLAVAEGPILVDPSAEGKDDAVRMCRGRVLSGATALKSRPLALVLLPDHQSVGNARRVEMAVNKRFFTTLRGVQTGMAKAKTDQVIELTVHPRYKDNIDRYMQVVRSVAVKESANEQRDRLEILKGELLEPETSIDAARQLEAVGRDGIPVLRIGLKSDNPEVRFYAAEALAYLDQTEAAEALAEAARNEPAFRVFALSALSAMDDHNSKEQLKSLLSVASAETRYGAFRALWAMNTPDPITTDDPQVKGFGYHVLATGGSTMIHVTKSRRPEIVLFGRNAAFQLPLAVNAGNQIMVTGTPDGEVSVARFAVGEADQKRIVPSRVDDVIRAIVELGGTYPDVVQALEEAKAAQALPCRFEVDALPEPGREYERVAVRSTDSGDNADGKTKDAGKKDSGNSSAAKSASKPPMPSLFASGEGPSRRAASDEVDRQETLEAEKKPGRTSFFSKLTGRKPE